MSNPRTTPSCAASRRGELFLACSSVPFGKWVVGIASIPRVSVATRNLGCGGARAHARRGPVAGNHDAGGGRGIGLRGQLHVLGADIDAAMVDEGTTKQPLVSGQQLHMPLAELAEETGRAFDVGHDERDNTSRER
jgi:hypothetical protein